MEAPNKIYMPNELLSEEWQRHIEGEDTEYIRKDFLIDWARRNQDRCFSVVEDDLWQDLAGIDRQNQHIMTNAELIATIREEIARLQPNAPKPGNMKSVDAKVAMQVHARLNKLLSFLSGLEKSLRSE